MEKITLYNKYSYITSVAVNLKFVVLAVTIHVH